MITALRHFFVDSWLGRLTALIVFVAFIGFGGTFVGMGGFGDTDNQITRVGDLKVTPQELAHSINQQIVFLQQTGVTPAQMQSKQAQDEISHIALRNLIVAKEAELAAMRNGIRLSDETILQAVHDMPEFKGSDGQFDSAKMEEVLSRNGLDHAFLINQTRRMLNSQATLLGFGGAATLSPGEINQVATYFSRIRLADIAEFPFDAQPAVTRVDDATLKRFFDNHRDLFTEPEFRHARIVALTSESVAQTLEVPDEVLKKLYESRSRDYNMPETRSVEVLSFKTQGEAQKAAQAWRSVNEWAEIQKQYPQAIAANLGDARQSDFPDPVMAKAIFAAKEGEIAKAVQTDSGWSVVHVTNITAPRHVTFEQVHDKMRDEVRKSEADVALKARFRNFEEAIAESTTLDKVPDNIGAVPAEGSLDAQGMTQAGVPAPLPGNEGMRKAIVRQIFEQKEGEFPHAVSLPDGNAFAVLVDKIIPGRQKKFEEAHTQILMAWQADQKKHQANIRATDFYQKAKSAKSLKDAIGRGDKDIHFRSDLRFSVEHAPDGIPALIVQAVGRMDPDQIVMLESGNSFWLVHFTKAQLPPQSDYMMMQKQLSQQLNMGLQNDLSETVGMAYTRQVLPKKFDPALFGQVSQSALQQILAVAGRGQ
ncbi:peptidyl-prolyl cis-trans isomerase [Acetobacteraceae bacterium ESL0709]|nr:peptidyl-prolyl cis-trans isomerase [Acetobacteraceae bacterium ESL0697]MDF7677919.1 peptidyl-prolyl cis-trans isomerase [Acetobacteraceae bacterium ESL0709]